MVSLTNTVALLKVPQSATWKSNGIPDIKGIFKVTRPTVHFISQESFCKCSLFPKLTSLP